MNGTVNRPYTGVMRPLPGPPRPTVPIPTRRGNRLAACPSGRGRTRNRLSSCQDFQTGARDPAAGARARLGMTVRVRMRILIMGSGGIGGYYGARLTEAGHDVVFVARG